MPVVTGAARANDLAPTVKGAAKANELAPCVSQQRSEPMKRKKTPTQPPPPRPPPPPLVRGSTYLSASVQLEY
jgi:hypothetical protein